MVHQTRDQARMGGGGVVRPDKRGERSHFGPLIKTQFNTLVSVLVWALRTSLYCSLLCVFCTITTSCSLRLKERIHLAFIERVAFIELHPTINLYCHNCV